MRRVYILAALLGYATFCPARCRAQSDVQDYVDAYRPVCRLGRDHATLQWFTHTPSETRLQLRRGAEPCNTPHEGGKPVAVWQGSDVRVVEGPAGRRTWHVLDVAGLLPGTRYYYRIYDPGSEPTGLEKRWGAARPWRREYCVSTLAPAGRKTIVRVPIKVLLMPNVLNVASAHDPSGQPAPPPPKLTQAQLALVRREYADSARFLFINNGMRVWFDYHIVVDDRWQRWGPEPANVGSAYRGWPVCRSYAGVDFSGPGGGDFTIVDTRQPTRVTKEPVYGEPDTYAGQVEQAFPRRWDSARKTWVFYNSGGGTFGLDDWPAGVPGRSQYLGGGDTAWLATHEYHHQIESLGTFSLSNREDDRVIFDHFAPRHRTKRPDGTWDDWAWSTSWRHGEHWDGIASFDRMLTPVQWLRLMWGQTITTADADGDGIPDDDPRLPFDEKRFGSDPRKRATDGFVPDMDKVRESTWAPTPLTTSWDKAPYPRVRPRAAALDSDGDGVPDYADPYPLYPWQPFIWPMTARVDGNADEWAGIPLAGEVSAHGVRVRFQQAHDDNFYYACFRLSGPWAHASVGFDPEGQGYYTTNSTYSFDIVNPASGGPPSLRVTSGNKCPGMTWKAGVAADGEATVEISVQNRGDSLWYWTGGGREVGTEFSLWTSGGQPLSMYEPYNLFYARMLERSGRADLPAGAPAELLPGPGVLTYDFAQGRPDGWRSTGKGWEWRDGALRHHDTDGESVAYLGGRSADSFDIWADFEAKNDFHLGAWAPGTAPGSETDYVVFLGGYGNARSVVRLFGAEAGAEDVGIPPGRHTAQLTRRAGQVWLLLDGKPLAWAPDPQPKLVVDRFGFVGGWGGDQVIYRVRIRTP